MKWFKHYSNSLHSNSLSALLTECGLEGYARYWLLLEELAERFDGKSVSFRIQIADIRSLFRIRSWNELDSFAVHLSNVSGLKVKRNGNVFEIEAPILLDLLGKDFRVTRQARASAAPKNKNEIKNKDLDKELDIITRPEPQQQQQNPTSQKNEITKERIGEFEVAEKFKNEPLLCEVLPFISTKVQENWLRKYETSWITEVLVNATNWHLTNSGALKVSEINDWGRKLTTWVARQKKPLLIESGNNTMREIEQFEAEIRQSELSGGQTHGN